MQLQLNDKEYIEVKFWSFTKAVFLSHLAIIGIAWGISIILVLILGWGI